MKKQISSLMAIILVVTAIFSMSGCTNSAKQQSTDEGSQSTVTVFGSSMQEAGLDIGLDKIKVKDQDGTMVSVSIAKDTSSRLVGGVTVVTIMANGQKPNKSQTVPVLALQAYKLKDFNNPNAVITTKADTENTNKVTMFALKELKTKVIWQNDEYVVADIYDWNFGSDMKAATEYSNNFNKDSSIAVDYDWLKTARQQVVDALAKK